MISSTKKGILMHRFRLGIILFLIIYSMMQKIVIFENICKNRFLPLIMLLSSGVLFCIDFFGKGRMFKSKYIILPILFIVSTAISSLINIRYGIYTNVMVIIYLVIEYSVLYPFEGYLATAKSDFKIISYAITTFSFLLSIYTYISYLFYFEYIYIDQSLRKGIDQGYRSVYRRAWGFYYETNWQGITSIIVIFLCLYLIFNSKKLWVKILNVLNIIYHSGVLVLTGSRSSSLAIYISVGVLIWYISYEWIKKYKLENVKQQILRVSCGAVAVLACFGIIFALKLTLPVIQKTVQDNIKISTRIQCCKFIKKLYDINNLEARFINPTLDENQKETEFEIQKIERLDINSKEDKSNGRVKLWKDGIVIITKSPIFGTTHGYLGEFVQKNFPEADIELLEGNSLLSGYLDLIVTGGLLATIIMFVFLFLVAKKLWEYQKEDQPHRTDLGFILSAISAIFVFITFTSDLFYYRSSITYIFIILLGYGMCLIKEDNLQKHNTDNLFVAFTPYQVLNAVNYTVSKKENEKTDIYIYDLFPSAEKVANNLRASNLFDSVLFFKEYKEYPSFIQKFITLFRILEPEFTLKFNSVSKYEAKNYKSVFASGMVPIVDSARYANPQARFYEFEDGVGTYFQEMESMTRTRIFNLVNKFLFRGSLSLGAEGIYLYNPEFIKRDIDKKIIKLPKIQDNDIIKKIFDYKPNTVYKDNMCVYLTQPLSETKIGEKAKSYEDSILSDLKNVLLRVHPRQSAEEYSGFNIDKYNNLWELECCEQITDQHILIGALSTAQFTPKILCDKEPTVIFTYRLYGDFYEEFTPLVEKLRSVYRNPEKVIILENINQLKMIINR